MRLVIRTGGRNDEFAHEICTSGRCWRLRDSSIRGGRAVAQPVRQRPRNNPATTAVEAVSSSTCLLTISNRPTERRAPQISTSSMSTIDANRC